MLEKIAKNQHIVLKAPQSIVHIKHTISLRQYKYWVLLLRFYREFFEAKEKPDENGFYNIQIAKIAEYLGYEPVKTELKTDFETLRKEPIIINFLDKDGKKAIHGMGFISEWKITSKTIAFKIPSFLESVMRGDNEASKIFQLLNWSIFNSFSGKYEAIIYKLCKDYIGIKRTPYMTISEYREYIGLKENEYSAIDNFTRRCITNPIKSINKNEISDIEVSVGYMKTGRKVDGLYFTVKEKKQTTLPFPEFEPHPAFSYAKVFISPEQQQKHLEIMTPEEIESTIKRANHYGETIKSKGQKAEMGAIYHKAFVERWGLQYIEQDKADKEEQQKKLEKQKQEKELLEIKIKTEQQEKEAKEKRILAFEALPENERKSIIDDFINQVDNFSKKRILATYEKHGINAHREKSIFRELFMSFLKRNENN
jgi:hypothetical protein